MQPSLMLPFQLTPFPPDRFQILGLIGQGGMGRVHKVRDRHLNRIVALKVPHLEHPEALRRLWLEAQHQAALEHPNVLPILEMGIWEDRACLVLPFVDGPSLEKAVPKEDWREAVRLVAQAARGVHAAHRMGLVHRDLKPQNILVEIRSDEPSKAMVTDFGLARATDGETSSLPGTVMGSPPYMSPEQLEGSSLVDGRSDIYSLGATLYTLLTGSPPFHASTADEAPKAVEAGSEEASVDGPRGMALYRKILEEPPKGPRQLNPKLPADLETVILTCLEKEPHHRYPTAEALAADLERVLQAEPIQAQRPSLLRRGRLWVRRHPHVSLAIVLVAGLGLLGGLIGGLAIRETRIRSRVAGRFEMLARELESAHRLANLSPQHDRSSAARDLDVRVEAMRAEARELGSVAEAPFAYAMGRVALFRGRPKEAVQQLNRAWELGHRSEAVSEALADALLDVYQDEVRSLVGPGERKSAIQALRQMYLEPSLAHYRRVGGSGSASLMHAARYAYLEGRRAEALDRIHEVLRQAPWRYEGYLLEHRVLLQEAGAAGSRAAFLAAAAKAQEAIDKAINSGRSDPEVRLELASWYVWRDQQTTERFGEPLASLPELGREALDTALQLDSGSVEIRILRASFWNTIAETVLEGWRTTPTVERCVAAAEADLDQLPAEHPQAMTCRAWSRMLQALARKGTDRERRIQEAVRLSERSVQLAPKDPGALGLRATIAHFQANECLERGQDDLAPIQKALAILHRQRDYWPSVSDHHRDIMRVHELLAVREYHRGDVGRTRQAVQDGLAAGTHGLRTIKDPNGLLDIRMEMVSLYRLDAAFKGLRGESMEEDHRLADRAISEAGPLVKGYVNCADQLFTLRYEQALVRLGNGQDIGEQIRQLRDFLDQGAREGLSGSWLAVNRAYLCRLEALWMVRQGKSSREAAQRGLAALRVLGTREPVQSQGIPSRAVRSSLEFHLASSDAERKKAAEAISGVIGRDPIMVWIHQPELRIAQGKRPC